MADGKLSAADMKKIVEIYEEWTDAPTFDLFHECAQLFYERGRQAERERCAKLVCYRCEVGWPVTPDGLDHLPNPAALDTGCLPEERWPCQSSDLRDSTMEPRDEKTAV